MADSMIQNALDITSRYNYTQDVDPTVNRWEEEEKNQALYEDKSSLSFTDMLGLMVAQFQNQTIDNQADTSDMMNQLVQMSVMQAMTDMTSQMKELTLANVMSYSASLVGQTVTIGVYNAETKKMEELVGVVEGAGTYNGQQVIFVDGKSYLLSSIMAVGKLPPMEEDDKTEGSDNEGSDGENSGSGDNGGNSDNETEKV